MDLPKAIEILELKNQGWVAPAAQDLFDAIRLGIEALQFRLRLEQSAKAWNYKLLPGQTRG